MKQSFSPPMYKPSPGGWLFPTEKPLADVAQAAKYIFLAEKGTAEAQFILGTLYEFDQYVSKDHSKAAKWYRKAAEQGHMVAQTSLGSMYRKGDGVKKDPAEALKWYRRAADKGEITAQSQLGYIFHNGEGVTKDRTESAKWYRMAAEQGDADAQEHLGGIYWNADGVARDTGEAVQWYSKAAKQGHVGAQFNLGVAWDTGDAGEGVEKNPTEAVKWYRMAAERGFALAQTKLGLHYLRGLGVLKDEFEALAWFTVSAISASPHAESNRDLVESKLSPQAIFLARQRAKELLKQIEANKAAREAKPNQSKFDPSTAKPVDLASEYSFPEPKLSGTGSIVSSSGHVLTAAHVVANASMISVITAQGTKSATVVRIDAPNDLAVLKLDDGTYPVLPVASSRRVRLGQAVATIGFPNIGIQGFSPKLTRGEISSLNGLGDDPRGWQISVPVQPGNSGGPLLDENGHLIGVVLAKLSLKAATTTGDLPQNVSYAVKSAYVLALVEPYLDANAPDPTLPNTKPKFEDMVATAQKSAVLILVY